MNNRINFAIHHINNNRPPNGKEIPITRISDCVADVIPPNNVPNQCDMFKQDAYDTDFFGENEKNLDQLKDEPLNTSNVQILSDNNMLVESIREMLKVDTNYDKHAVDIARKALMEYMEKLFQEKYSCMGMVSLLSSNESLVDRFRMGAAMRDGFYSLLAHVMYRALNMDTTINGCKRMRTYTGRGNVLIDTRLYPYDNITQTAGLVYIWEDDLESRFGARFKFIKPHFQDQEEYKIVKQCMERISKKSKICNFLENIQDTRVQADKRRRQRAMFELNFDVDF